MNKPGLHDKIICYLSPEAAFYLNELVEIGLDRDLALIVIEKFIPEEAMYELGDEEDMGA